MWWRSQLWEREIGISGKIFLCNEYFYKTETWKLRIVEERVKKTSELANQTMEFLGHGFVKMESWEYFW